MGLKDRQLFREFELSAKVSESQNSLLTKEERSSYSAEVSLDISVQTSLSWALMTAMHIHNADLLPYYVAVPLPEEEQDRYSFTICMPDEKKGNLLTQPALYDAMDRFLKRFIREGDDPDLLYTSKDYTNHHVTLYYQPEHLKDTLHQMTHKIYRGNETILGHLYMAQHLMDWKKDYRPALQIN